MRTCSVEGCAGRHEARGLCSKHYQDHRYNADPSYRAKKIAASKRDYADNRAARLSKANTSSRERYARDMKDTAKREARRARNLSYNKTNGRRKAQLAANEASRRARTKKATPAWADREKILALYLACPEGFEVDHIVPLRGKNVSGLHVEYNLQYLPGKENARKNNTWPIY